MNSLLEQALAEASLLIKNKDFKQAIILLEASILPTDDASAYAAAAAATEQQQLQLADCLEKLAVCHIALNSLNNESIIIGYFQRVISIRKRILPVDHDLTNQAQKDCGVFLASHNRYNTALTYLRNYMESCQRKYGNQCEDNMDMIISKYYLGKCYLYNRCLLEAKECFLFCFEKCKSKVVVNKSNISIIECGSQYGNVLSLLDNHIEAIKLLRDMYDNARQLSGDEGIQTLDAMSYLAYALMRSGKFQEGKLLFDQCLTAKQKVLGEFHQEVLNLHEELIHIKERENNFEEAVDQYQALYQTCAQHFGFRHGKTLEICCSMLSAIERLSLRQQYKKLSKLLEVQSSHDVALDTQMKVVLVLIKLDDCVELLIESLKKWLNCWIDSKFEESTQLRDIECITEKVLFYTLDNHFNYKDECVDLAEKLTNYVKTMSSGNVRRSQNVGDWLMAIYYRSREHSKLLAIFEEACRQSVEKFGTQSLQTCRCIMLKAHHFRYCEQYSVAIENYVQCATLYQRCVVAKVGDDPSLHLEIAVFLNACYLSMSTKNDKIDSLSVLFEACKSTFGERHVITLNALVNLILSDDTQRTDSLENLIGSIDKNCRIRDNIRPHLMLATILRRRNEHLRAIKILEPLVDMLQQNYGNDFVTLQALRLLGESYCNVRRTVDGQMCLQLCYEQSVLVRGNDNFETEQLRIILSQGKAAGIMFLLGIISVVAIVLYFLVTRVGVKTNKIEL